MHYFEREKKHDLTHEVLSTFLSEVYEIVNSRPLVEFPTDPENPVPLSLSMLLTQKPNPFVETNVYKDLYRAQWKMKDRSSKRFSRRCSNTKRQFIGTLLLADGTNYCNISV